MSEKSLTELGQFFETDKTLTHNFTEFYEEKLKHLKNEKINILEIGIMKGESLRMWKEYFPNAVIYAVDINDLKYYQEDRIFIEQCDQTDHIKMNSIFPNVKFDVIIDDGGHSMFQQQFSLISIFNRLKKGGFYILEDLHTSLEYHYFYNNDLTKKTALELLENFSDKKEEFDGFHVHKDNIKTIYDRIESCEIYKTREGKSITSLIVKKINF